MRPIRIFMAVQVTRDMSIMFIAATYAPFLKQIGLDNVQITIINWVFAALMLLAQVPTGLFADRFGRALSVKIGLAVLMVGHFLYFYATGFKSALLIEGIVGIGFAFVSGADQAWLTAAMNAEGQGQEMETVFGKVNAVSFATCLISGSAGAMLGQWNLRWPWIACGTAGAFSLVLSLLLMREPRRDESAEIGKKGLGDRELVRLSLLNLRQSYELKWGLACMFALAFTVCFFHYWPLVFREYASSSGLAVIWAIIYAPKVLGAAVMAKWGKRMANGWGVLAIAVSVPLSGIGLAFAGVSSNLFVLLAGTILFEAAIGYYQPLMSAFVQKRVGEDYRATYGSLQSLITGSWSVVLMVGIAGAMAVRPDNVSSIKTLWWQLGAVMVLAFVPLYFFRPVTAEDSQGP